MAITVTGSRTEVGQSDNTFTYAAKEDTNLDNYTVSTEVGKLTVTPVTAKVTVTIVGKNNTCDYDGIEHSVSGYDVVIGNPLYNFENWEIMLD